jgi:hypothetical protein
MAGKVTANTLQIGDSGTANNNFHLKTNGDGSLSLNRGNDGASTQELIKVKTDGNQEVLGLPSFQCRAWVNFNGTRNVTDTGASTNGQPVFIRASGNVTSVVKNAVGDYTVNFTTAMPDANYSATGNSYVVSGLIGIIVENQVNSLKTTTQYRIAGFNTVNSAFVDLNTMMVAIFR